MRRGSVICRLRLGGILCSGIGLVRDLALHLGMPVVVLVFVEAGVLVVEDVRHLEMVAMAAGRWGGSPFVAAAAALPGVLAIRPGGGGAGSGPLEAAVFASAERTHHAFGIRFALANVFQFELEFLEGRPVASKVN